MKPAQRPAEPIITEERKADMFRKTIRSTCLALAILALVAAPTQAQDSEYSLEVRTGATFPTGDLEDDGAETGLLFGGDLMWSAFPRMSLYGGYAWYQFNFDGTDDDITASGPAVGVKYLFMESGRALPWIRGGLTFNGTDGFAGDPDRELGLEIGGGADIELSPRFSLTPAIRYKTFSQETTGGDVDLSWMTLDLGAHFHF